MSSKYTRNFEGFVLNKNFGPASYRCAYARGLMRRNTDEFKDNVYRKRSYGLPKSIAKYYFGQIGSKRSPSTLYQM